MTPSSFFFYDVLLAGGLYRKRFANMGVSYNLPSDVVVAIYILSRMKRRCRLDHDGQQHTCTGRLFHILLPCGCYSLLMPAQKTLTNCAQPKRSASRFIYIWEPCQIAWEAQEGTPPQKISPTREKGGPVHRISASGFFPTGLIAPPSPE